MSNHASCCHCESDFHTETTNLNKEIGIIIVIVILFSLGIITENKLHNTNYQFIEYLIFIPTYLLSGWSVLTSAGKNILRGKVFDENFLMTIATLGAFAIHEFPEAVAVMFFFRIGELCQNLAVNNSRKSIKSLLEIRPDYANLKVNNEIKKISPNLVKVGDIILVNPGEKIPLDGEVITGESQVDTSPLTGESTPRHFTTGKTVLAGMLNQTGVLVIKVTKLFTESSITKILDLVENATRNKAKTEKFITRFARYYSPIVVVLSLLVALLPPLFIPNSTSSEWVYRALILLVISCPCGLVISIPLGYFGGIGGAAKRGILIKGSTFLDSLKSVKKVIFDKTGTLTKGVFKVTEIVPYNGFDSAQLLSWAAAAEYHSNHPISQSIKASYTGKLEGIEISNYQEIPGYGIRAKVDNKSVIAGSDRLLHQENIDHNTCHIQGTIVHLAIDNKYAGYISIADEIKTEAIAAISSLKKLEIEQIIMLTGDREDVAKKIANQLNLDSYQAELLPENKLTSLEAIINQSNKNEKVAFVGDGINDAPVMARADVGIAMGGLGSDAAIETADVVLMTDNPSQVAEAIKIGKKTYQIIWQNISFALGIKGLFILLGLIGIATLWEAVFADVGVALLAIVNANRIIYK